MTILKTAVATCTKNDGPYLKEWIAFYKIIGFDTIIIYNNESSDETESLLKTYQSRGLIEYKFWPTVEGISPQISAFNDIFSTGRDDIDFIGLFDTDEFLVPQGEQTLKQFLSSLSSEVSAVSVNQRVFGSSGKIVYEDELVTKRFQQANFSKADENEFFKTISRFSAVASVSDPHYVNLKSGIYVNTCGEPFDVSDQHAGRAKQVCEGGFRLNHYMLKSWEEFERKRMRGGGAGKVADQRLSRFDDNYFKGRDQVSNKEFSKIAESIESQVRGYIADFLS